MTPTSDDFQALARSSPWRWRSAHFVHRSSSLGVCEAWVRRPGELLVRDDAGHEHRESGLPYTRSSLRAVASAAVGDPDGVPPPPPLPSEPVLPHEATPQLRPDGLVAVRPTSFEVDYDDPMWGNYSWVAMLDPVELSHDVEVRNVRVGEWAGRPTWEALLRPLEDYRPRCGCCSLLRSPVIDREEWGDRFVERRYPDHHEVALDVATGVVVRLHPVGGEEGGAWLENDLLEVDAEFDAEVDAEADG